MLLDEFSALPRAVVAVLDRAFPLEHRPAIISIDGEAGKDRAEIDVAVAKRAEAARAVRPFGVARINALLWRGTKLRVLHMKRFDALVVNVDEPDVVERLQAKMRRIVIDAAALVALELVEEALKRDAIKQILARVQFESDVDALILVRVEDRLPAASQLVERGFYE